MFIMDNLHNRQIFDLVNKNKILGKMLLKVVILLILLCRCGSRGNCLEYDNEKLIWVTAAVAAISKFFTMLFFALAWKFLKPPPTTVEVNGNGGVNYRGPDANGRCDTTLI
jgi:hypothetical protein